MAVNDLVGKRIGILTLQKRFYKKQNNGRNASYYECLCDCGNTCIVSLSHLQSGHTKSCGCLKHTKQYEDISGNRYGILTVLSYSKTIKNKAFFKVQCDCGIIKDVSSPDLKAGKILSCGCLGKIHRKIGTTKHGGCYTRLYKIWSNMKARCFIKSSIDWKWSCARGITICDDWLDFDCFRKWAYNNGYADNLTIERKDFNGNYEPNNCTWIPLERQNCNTRKNHFLTYHGKTQCISDWCRELNLSKNMLYNRLRKGYSVDRAIKESVR